MFKDILKTFHFLFLNFLSSLVKMTWGLLHLVDRTDNRYIFPNSDLPTAY